jgi:hypothetical protein
VIDENPQVPDILGVRDGEGAIRVPKVKVGERGTVCGGGPSRVVEGNELSLIAVNMEVLYTYQIHPWTPGKAMCAF